MKTVTLTAVLLVVGTSGFLIKVPTVPSRPSPNTGSAGYVHLQKLLLPLFENVCEESVNPTTVRLAQEFGMDSTKGFYLRPEVITEFQKLKTEGLLPKGEIFTDYNPEHRKQLRVIFELFYYAKDFDTFYKAASWSKQNLNCGLFVRAIYLAIINRRDTEKLSVPAPYEIFPNYFITKDVIGKASALLAGEEVVLTDNIRDEGNSYVLDANYTAEIVDNNEESKLAYFHEDLGLNTYYFLQKLKRSWVNSAMESNMYGEYLYHMMKQLAARYSLERYANGFQDIENINLEELTATAYDPMLIYSNGNEFGHRSSSIDLLNSKDFQMMQTIETNIASVVTHLINTGYNKTQILDHLMNILVTGERSFEKLLVESVGKDATYSISQPSVLDHFMTSMRDPMFWKINKKIVEVVDNALKQLPVYSRNELYFPGVEVLNIEVKKMMTNFDYFQFDVTDSLKTESTNTAFQVKVGQQRLNHKSFTVKLNISSLVTQKGLVKIYLGPKTAPGELALKKNMFVLFDNFEWNFKVGSNVISRSSDDMKNYSEDFTSLRTLRKNVEDAEFGLDALPLKSSESYLGFPQRFLLPKGTPEGLPLQVFVFVAPFVKTISGGIYSLPSIEFNSAILSPGYPLDLDINDAQLFDLPNAMVKDVFVMHKGDKLVKPGGTKNWPKGDYDPSTRTQYGAGRKEPFDYAAKKAEYGRKEQGTGKQEDYAAKREYYKGKGKFDNNEEVTTEDTKNYISDNIIATEENFLHENEAFEKESPETEPVYDTKLLQKVEEEDDDSALPLPRAFTRKPTVYDYILPYYNPEDYYDEVNIDSRVYE
ncbi:hemocyanin, ig-like domain-containing protein [Phthorimaea operculella]|nr:hemocyanin, ig-like domain-containing protein [Phthorimaea operculella]